MNKRLGLLALACGLAGSTLWAGVQLLSAGTALANGAAPVRAAPPGPGVDPRWLQLVRALAAPPGTQAPASAGPTLDYLINDRVLAGHVALPNNLTISITHGSATLVTFSLAPFPDQGGFLYAVDLASEPIYLFPGEPQAGDVIWVSQASASVSLTVPLLTGLAWPATDVVSGTAPANAALQLFLYPYADPATVYTRTATANGSGQYQSLWSPGVDVRPRDSGFVLLSPDVNRHAYARFVAPFLRAQVGGYGTDGTAAPGSQVTVTVSTLTGTLIGTRLTVANPQGHFDTCLGDCPVGGDFLPAYVAGDVVTATASGQTFWLTVPPLTAHANLAGGAVQGQAAPGQPVVITRFAGPVPQSGGDDGPPVSQAVVTATAGGAYSLALPLAPRDYGEATVTTAQGNAAYARFAVPYLNAQLGPALDFGYVIQGQVDDLPGPLTITVQGASGPLKGLRFAHVGTAGFFSDPYYYYYPGNNSPDIALEAGDQITLTTARGVALAYKIPLLTAQADVPSQIISGQAPPGARVTINLSTNDFKSPLSGQPWVVTATAQGRYSLNFAPLGHFDTLAAGSVMVTSPEGYLIVRNFQALQSCLPLLEDVQVGGTFIRGIFAYKFQFDSCGPATLALRDGQGHTKFSQVLQFYPGFDFAIYVNTQNPATLIQPGDHIALSTGSQSQDTLVPPLSIVPNPPAGTLSGQAPASAGLTIYVSNDTLLTGRAPTGVPVTATANAQGHYLFTYPVSAGNQVSVRLNSSPQFFASSAAPILRVALHRPSIEALAAPFSPYTLALLGTPLSKPASITGTADPSGIALLNLAQAPWTFEPGDTLVMTTPAGTRSLAMPALTAQFDPDSGKVSGTAPAGARLTVYLAGLSQVVTATAQGHYAATFGEQEYNTTGAVVFANAEGDEALLNFSAPRWSVTLDSPCVAGYASLPGTVATLALTAPGGSVKSTTKILSSPYDGDFVACLSAPVAAGDRLSLSWPGMATTYTVPSLSASYDMARHWVTGLAPAKSLVTLSLFDERLGKPIPATRQLFAAGNGSYTLDVSDLQLRLDDTASAMVQDSDGNSVLRIFTIEGLQTFLPLIARP